MPQNDHWLYLFIRQDLPIEHQITQSNHATYALALAYNPSCEVPNIVTIGVPDLAALKRVQTKLVQNQIPHYAWVEPDLELGFTSITTVPLDYNQKQVLKNYRVYRGGAAKVACRVNPDAPTNSPEQSQAASLQ